MSDKTPEIRKLVTIGDAQVGKSSLIYRVTHNQTPNVKSATIGAAFFCMNTKDGRYRLNMWDTAGQERFRSMVPVYLRDVHIIVFVYDITDVRSFEHLRDYWIDFAMKHAKTPQIATVSSPILISQPPSSPSNRSNSNPQSNRTNSNHQMNRTHSQSLYSLHNHSSNYPKNDNQTRSQSYDNNPFNQKEVMYRKSVFDEENDEKEYNSGNKSNGSSRVTLKKDEPLFVEKTKPFCIIVANKSDLNAYRKVSTEDGIELAKSINCPFIELSALNGTNTDQLMNLINEHVSGNDIIKTNENTIILDDKGFIEKTISGCSC